uniref:Uncharacterized protein n=1 Tax=Catharus ustulatus TaxID=91951 RepID=A0A8C3V3H6_CATUS
MTSTGNEIERWTHRQGGRTGKLVEPVTSPENDHLLSVKSISSMDHLLHLPGKADSAYSSFSGGSNIPGYLTPSCHGENCVLPEQVPYTDLEHVTGMYHLSAAHSDLRSAQSYKAPDLSTPSSHSTSLTDRCGIAPTQRTSNQESPALAAPPLSPPTRLNMAQKKVLKETSFKRKDLQMSLPVRLRQKSSKRPSVERLWSFSLSSASKDAKPAPCSPSPGGRKRVTQEQNKLCYSEPEKLHHLMDKEVSWNTMASRRRGLAFSSSSVSRTELKQIQHSALIEYMERKTTQRPGGSQHLPLHKPPLQKRLSDPKGPYGQISNPNGSRKMQKVFCQLLSEQKSPDISPLSPFAPPLKATSSGSKESTQVEEECRTLSGNASLKHPEQQQPAPSPKQGMHLHTASAQPQQGDKNPAKGLLTQETSMHSNRADVPLERETHLPKSRLQSSQDQQHQDLVMEIIAKDSSLVNILMPHPLRKTALDLMEGLFPLNISMLDKSLSVIIIFFFLQLELMASLQSRLQALWEEQDLVLLEVRECAKWGEELEVMVRDLCKPSEFDRYMMFIGDLEKVVSLLLCLSSRLARVQNAMSRMDGNTEQSLNERYKLLCQQREDAKDLKENLDRRERVVSGILAKYMTEQQLQDYQHFVQVKTSLLIEQKDLEEQIKFFKEQLENLDQSTLWTCPPLGQGALTASHSV